jgi:hypothetical protein
MSTELTEAERAAAKVIDASVFDSEMTLVNNGSREDIARAIVAAVAPIIKRETLAKFGDRMGTFNPPLYREPVRGDEPLNDPSIFSNNP